MSNVVLMSSSVVDGGPACKQHWFNTHRPFGYERVYLSLYKVADTPFNIQGDDMHNTDVPGATFNGHPLRLTSVTYSKIN